MTKEERAKVYVQGMNTAWGSVAERAYVAGVDSCKEEIDGSAETIQDLLQLLNRAYNHINEDLLHTFMRRDIKKVLMKYGFEVSEK